MKTRFLKIKIKNNYNKVMWGKCALWVSVRTLIHIGLNCMGLRTLVHMTLTSILTSAKKIGNF